MLVKNSKLPLKQYPPLPGKDTAEDRYWQSFKNPILLKQYGPVTFVDFSPVQPFEYAVTSSTRVQLFDPNQNEPLRAYSKFKDVAYSGSFRSDGKLIVAGGEEKMVRVFDVKGKDELRRLKGHTAAVRLTKFSYDNIHVLSGSNDKTVRYWDIAEGTAVHKFNGHEDYVWCGSSCRSSPDLWVTGSYDHRLKLWDTRTSECVLTVNHGFPVESVLMFPSGSLFISAGGNQLKVWDILSGGKLLATISNHQKTITCLGLSGDGTRLLSGGLDHYVKVYDVSNYEVTHTFTYPAPVMSLAVSPESTHLVVGMSDGSLSIRTRNVSMEEISKEKEKQDDLRRGTYRYFLRGKNSQAGKEDFRVIAERRKHLQDYEKFLNKFQYQNALNAVVGHKMNTNVVVVVSMFEELISREGLARALQGRNENSLQPILEFLLKYITNPRYAPTLTKVLDTVLDLYSSVVGQAPIIDGLLQRIQKKLLHEKEVMKNLLEIKGALDMLLTASSSVDTKITVESSKENKNQTNQTNQTNSTVMDVVVGTDNMEE